MLEKQLAKDSHPHTHAGALQKELDSVKERSKKTVSDMEKETEKLRKEVTRLKNREQSNESPLFITKVQPDSIWLIKSNDNNGVLHCVYLLRYSNI